MSDCLFYWKNKSDQPNKLGGIDAIEALIIFSEAQLYIEDKQIIVYGHGMAEKSIVKNYETNKWEQYDFKDGDELLQVSLPLETFKDGNYEKTSTDFTRIVGKYLKHHLEGKTLKFYFQLNKINPRNLTKLEENLDFTIDKDPGSFFLPDIFPNGFEIIEPNKLKDFKYTGHSSSNNGNKNYSSGNNKQYELNRLNNRWEFLKSMLYEKDFDHKDFTIKEIAKAYKSLDTEAQEIINLLMMK